MDPCLHPGAEVLFGFKFIMFLLESMSQAFALSRGIAQPPSWAELGSRWKSEVKSLTQCSLEAGKDS